MSADLMDVFGQDSRRREQSREMELYVQNVNAVMPGLVTAAELIASTVRFLYFNRSNLAMKSTLYMLPHEDLEVSNDSVEEIVKCAFRLITFCTQGQPELSQSVLNVMLDLWENFTGGWTDGNDNECYVKLADDQWVIGKCSDKRQIYVVICERCANLMDAADEMERLMLTEFKNICLNE